MSYHLVEVGATPEQELAFGLSIAVAYLDKVKPQMCIRGRI